MAGRSVKWLFKQPLRGATATTMGRSTTLVTTATGGRVQRTQVRMRGTET